MAEKKSRRYEVGDEIETECTKCKTKRVHVITSMTGNTIKKVMCKGCYTTRTYRGPQPESAATHSTAKPARKRSTSRRKRNWNTLMAEVDDAETVDYDIHEAYGENQPIRHKQFGVGVVTKILADNKIEVVFQDQTRVLAQNWS